MDASVAPQSGAGHDVSEGGDDNSLIFEISITQSFPGIFLLFKFGDCYSVRLCYALLSSGAEKNGLPRSTYNRQN